LEETERLEGIAVIGVVGRFPGAPDADRFWYNLRDGVEAVTQFTDSQLLSAGLDPVLINQPTYVKSGILLDDIEMFDAQFFGITPREAEFTDPQHRLFLELAWEAMENAGYDPNNFKGRVGVYAGSGPNSYFYRHLISNPNVFESLGSLQKLIATEKDYLATRVSYYLNLRGPSISVNTACSTSLVAVHLACQSLLNGEADMALAGGVAIQIPQITGYLYQEGAIMSPDGHCRAFDAAAQGTVGGSGGGIVVLKRLPDALTDGDNIRAVIRSSAINNDGAAKIGYTAPSVDGQASVIAEAQAMAAMNAEEISYIEAHGTGTPLGDPIEVAGLTRAFRRTTQKNGFCAIGSVKTNIGHLDAAAGVAGFIKVVLALENGFLPPSLHFNQPNPSIDFPGSPFYVQQKLSEWKPANGRRVAGVSSFGIGGTNAHVIIEEAPTAEPSSQSRPWQLLPISGKTPEALEKAASRLAEFLSGHRKLNLADVASTLQQGRRAFIHRRFMAVKNMEDAISLLQSRDPKRFYKGRVFEGDAVVAFMFPAQGAQHVNMGRDLYENESVFRESVDRCAEHLLPKLDLDIRKILYPEEKDVEEASEQLRQTIYTQPAIYIVDYALARLWMSWGIMPSAMIGHSLGEYVAATIAGVFDLQDALTLIAERARLMQALPSGSMLAVHLSEEELQPWLRDDISLASVNAPGLSVVSGLMRVIDQLAVELKAKKIEFHPLRTSHAFHSAMMEPIVAPLVERVSQVARHRPQIPFISSLTGTWITDDQASDPNYWGKQTRYGVRFSSGVVELCKVSGRVLLEVGPGTTLSTLARLHLTRDMKNTTVSSLRHAKDTRPDYECLLTALGCMWMTGVAVDWKKLYIKEHRLRVQLPTYPFERKRYWLDEKKVDAARFTNFTTKEISASTPLNDNSTLMVDPEKGTSGDYSGDTTSIGVSLYSRPDLSTEYVIPQTETEKMLAKIWQNLLGVKEVGILDDFFELGGNSLLAVNIVSDVDRTMGKRIPLASLIQAPTIQQFARLIGEEQSKPSWSSLVTFNSSGSKPALFLMHSHGGNVLEYELLVHRLGKERPLYALQARGLDGNIVEEPRIEEMASHYLKEIRSIQSHGPYYLGGFCFGGMLAIEAAHQLISQNQEVALLILINAATKEYPNYYRGTTPVHRLLYSLAYRISLELDSLAGLTPRIKYAQILTRLRRLRDVINARGELLLEKYLEKFHRRMRKHSMTFYLERLGIFHSRAFEIYNPKPYDGKVLLIAAKRQPLGIHPDHLLGWKGLLTGEVQVREVPGFRQNMMDEPNVEILAPIIKDALEARQLARLAAK
jgi:phthiocerol/phenolphthiocerol synthesis type-I polyketide synthase E